MTLRYTCTSYRVPTLYLCANPGTVQSVCESELFGRFSFPFLRAVSSAVSVMVSGHGARGGRGRCFTLWKDFMSCVAQQGSYGFNVCQSEREDYLECLHHTKLVSICLTTTADLCSILVNCSELINLFIVLHTHTHTRAASQNRCH